VEIPSFILKGVETLSQRNQTRRSLNPELRAFYRENPPDLPRIPDVNRRHFRVALASGRFMKIPDVIRDARILRKWLVRLAPHHVYYSTAGWLNPVTLRPRPTKPGPDFLRSGIILSHDIAFDIDRTPLLRKNLEAARCDTLRLLDLMKEKGYRLIYCAFSGSKGFHLIYHDHDSKKLADPYEREMAFIESRTRLVEEVAGEGIVVDSSVTKDTRRIIRVPGTINTRTGYACTALERTELEMPIGELLETVPHIPSVHKIPRFVLPMPEMPKFPRLPGIFRKQKTRKGPAKAKRKKEQEDQGNQEFCYTTYLQSCVLGTKGRHVVLLSLERRPLHTVERALEKLVERFRLTDVYLFRQGQGFLAISLGTVQRNRYQKIQDATGATNAPQLLKYNVSSVRVGGLVDREMNELEPPVRFLKVVRAPEEHNRDRFVSAGHLNFIRKHGIETFDYPKVHGSGEFKLVDAVLKI